MNALDFWHLMGEGIALAFCQAPGYEFRADDYGWLVTAGEPYADFNCALVTPGSHAQESLLTASEFFLERSLPFLVCVIGETEAMAALAQDLDLRDMGPLPLMRYRSVQPPTALGETRAEVRRASSADDFARIAALNEECFGLPSEVAGGVAPFDATRDPRLSSLIAVENNMLLGAVSVSQFDGAFGIFGLMTKQSARRTGVATLLMCEAMAQIRRLSNDPVFLAATPMAKPLYDRLGFETIDVGRVWVGGAS